MQLLYVDVCCFDVSLVSLLMVHDVGTTVYRNALCIVELHRTKTSSDDTRVCFFLLGIYSELKTNRIPYYMSC